MSGGDDDLLVALARAVSHVLPAGVPSCVEVAWHAARHPLSRPADALPNDAGAGLWRIVGVDGEQRASLLAHETSCDVLWLDADGDRRTIESLVELTGRGAEFTPCKADGAVLPRDASAASLARALAWLWPHMRGVDRTVVFDALDAVAAGAAEGTTAP